MNSELSPIAPELLEPAQARPALEQSARPGRTYWQQVGGRLWRNPRAMVALSVIVTLLLAVAVGPSVYRVDPARLALGAAAQGPSRAQSALLVKDAGEWRAPTVVAEGDLLAAGALGAPARVVVENADTERVHLSWEPVEGAARYNIYRNTHAPRSRSDLGLPVGSTLARGEIGYEDRLLLRQRTYFYSVVATDGVDEAASVVTVAATPTLAISWLEAQLQGLIPAEAEPASWPSASVVVPAHPLGTDYLGRDLLARLLHGGRTSLFIGVTAALLYVALGALYGAAAGFIGGWVDDAMMRVADFVVALPFLLFMVLLRIAFGIGPGESGVLPLVVALLLMSWPATARLVRGQVLQLREESYVAVARLAGGSSFYIIARHMLPNVLAVILVALTFAIPQAIFTEAFLSFIGMGVTPPTPSWGSMSNDGIRNLLVHPSELMWPALCISVSVLAFNLLGDALRDALDVNVQERL